MSDEPEDTDEDAGEVERRRARGGCLTSFLVIFAVLSVLAAGSDLTLRRARMMAAPALLAPNVGYLFLALSHLVEIVSVIGVFLWKRWGVYGFFAVHAAFIVLSLWVGEGVLRTLGLGLVPPALLVFLVRRVGGEHFH
jgi:hypothetical protein